MSLYQLFLLPKFTGVFLFLAGTGGAVFGESLASRQTAVHRVASLGLLLTWVFGLLATETSGVPMTRPWIIGSLLLSLVTQGTLVATVSGSARRTPAHLAVIACSLLGTLLLMVWRP